MNQRNEGKQNMKVGGMKEKGMALLPNNESRDHNQLEQNQIQDKVGQCFPSIICSACIGK